MDSFDQKIRNSWAEAGAEFSRTESNAGFSISGRKTVLGRLCNRYLRFAIISFLFGILFLINGATNHQTVFSPTAWYCLSVFMGISSLADFCAFLWVSNIDIRKMSVAEVISRVAQIRKLHIIYVCVMFPVVTLFIVYIGFTLIDDTMVIYSMFIGYALGLAIGIRMLKRFLDDYKFLTSDN